MNEQTKSEIDTIMQKYNQTREQRQKEDQKRSGRGGLLGKFEEVKNKIILKTMNDLKDFVGEKGATFHIKDDIPHEIRLDILPTFHDSVNHTSLSFGANESSLKVSVYSSSVDPNTGILHATHDEFELLEITEDFVEKKILDLIKSSFGTNF